jgi:hypothetical protein
LTKKDEDEGKKEKVDNNTEDVVGVYNERIEVTHAYSHPCNSGRRRVHKSIKKFNVKKSDPSPQYKMSSINFIMQNKIK